MFTRSMARGEKALKFQGDGQLGTIEDMIRKLQNPAFRVTSKTRRHLNPYFAFGDGNCMNHESALAYWMQQLILRQEEIEAGKYV